MKGIVFEIQRFANVIHGDSGDNYGSNIDDSTQVYGLAGNDTIETNNSKNVLLIGGSGNDVIHMTGGTGTVNGGAGADTFKFTYSSANTISAVVEDLDPSSDKLVINYTGNGTPNIRYSTVGRDIVLTDDAGYFNVTLKGYREANDYFDGVAHENIWEVLKIVNQERENQGLGQLTLSKGLIDGASIRAVEIEDTWGHTRPDGTSCFTAVEKSYNRMGENIAAGYDSPKAVMVGWMNSTGHRANILTADFTKLGVGYFYKSGSYYGNYWVQMFGGALNETDSVSTAAILSAKTTFNVNGVTKSDSTLGNISSLKRTTISGTSSADLLVNGEWYGEKGTQNVVISAGAGADTISNSGSHSVLDGGTGNDLIYNGYYYHSGGNFYAGSYNGNYDDENKSSHVTITGGAGDDTFHNSGDSVQIYGDDGNDFIINGKWYNRGGFSVSLSGGDGNDTINSSGSNSRLDGGSGDDLIYSGYYFYESWGRDGFLSDSGVDSLNDSNGSSHVTISGGAGNDEIHSRGTGSNVFLYSNGDGNDTIYGYSSSDTISITGGAYTKSTVGSNIILSVGSGAVTLVDASDKTLNIVGTLSGGTSTSKIINGTEGNDNFTNTVAGATINALGGNDLISNTSLASAAVIYGGAGADKIFNYADSVTIDGGAGDDALIRNSGNQVEIYGGNGNDGIDNYGDLTTIDAGDGNDDISNYGYSVNVYAGAGKDYILNRGDSTNVYAGDDDDRVENYGDSAEISVGAGNDSVFNDGDNITIWGGAGNDSINNWGEDVTINAGAGDDIISLTRGNVQALIYNSGDGSDSISGVTSSTTIYVTGGAYAKSTVGDDVIISVGSGSMHLIQASGMTLNIVGTLEGGSTNGVSVNGSTLTATASFTGNEINLADYESAVANVNAAPLSNSVTIVGNSADNYLKGGKGADTIYGGAGNDTVVLGAGNDVYVYTSGNDVIQDYKSGQDKLKLDSASITGASNSGRNVILQTSEGNITVKGGKNAQITVIDSAGNETTNVYPISTIPAGISVKNATLTASTDFTGNEINLADYASKVTKVNASALSNGITIVGTAAANSVKGGKGDDTIIGGAGNDKVSLGAGNDVYVYSGGNDLIYDYQSGKDKIKLDGVSIIGASNSSRNVILQTSEGNITVKGGKNAQITVVDSAGNETTNVYPISTIPAGISVKNATLTASTDFTGNEINLADYASKVTKVNASALSNGITIVGTAAANSVKGGKGDDTIIGGAGNDKISLGAGNDVYVYSGGNDLIYDYQSGEDKIKLDGVSITGASNSGRNVILQTPEGNITVKGGKNAQITVIDSAGNETSNVYPLDTMPSGLSYDLSKKTLVVSNSYNGDTIDLANFATTVKTVNASALSQNVNIIGNSQNNTLTGGVGDDTLTGGSGKDVFVYGSGRGNDVIADYVAGQDMIQLSSGEISQTSYSGNDVVFTIGTGTLTVKNGNGMKIKIRDANNRTSTRTYSGGTRNSNALWFTADDNNFISATPNLDSIVDSKFAVTNIETATNFDSLDSKLDYTVTNSGK